MRTQVSTTILVAGLFVACAGGTTAPGPDQPAASVSKGSGAPGETLTVTGAGFPPETEVVIGAGPPQSEYEVIERVRTNREGSVARQVAIPKAAAAHDSYVFVVATNARIRAVSEPVAIADDSSEGDALTVTGTITDEGVECIAMRAEDGTLYTLGRPNEDLSPGDRVRVTGTLAEMSFCMQGTTLDVTRIERL